MASLDQSLPLTEEDAFRPSNSHGDEDASQPNHSDIQENASQISNSQNQENTAQPSDSHIQEDAPQPSNSASQDDVPGPNNPDPQEDVSQPSVPQVMANNNPAAVNSLEEFAECAVCLEPYDDSNHKPKFLECHHTFCFHCLTTLTNTTPGIRYKIQCPTCRISTRLPVDGVAGLQTNFYLEHLQITSKRTDQQHLDICNKHFQPKAFFCKTCLTAICSDCTVMDHKSTGGHTIVSIGESKGATHHVLQEQVELSHITMTQFRDTIQKIDCEMQKRNENKASIINDLHSFIQYHQEQLEQCKQKATDAILNHHTTEQTQLLSQKRQLQGAVDLLESDIAQSKEVAKSGNISEVQSSVQNLKKLNKNAKSDFSPSQEIRSCFASDVMTGNNLFKDTLCEIGQRYIQPISNLPTSVWFRCSNATAGLKTTMTVELFDVARKTVPFAASFLSIRIYDPWKNILPVTFNTIHPTCTVIFTPQRSGKHGISIQYMGQKLICKQTHITVNSNNPVLKFGKQGNGNGNFQYPWGIVIGENNCLYVADTGNGLIQKFTPDGVFLSQWPVNINGENYSVLDMAVDEDKGIILCPEIYNGYTGSYNGNNVFVFDMEGQLQQQETNRRKYLGEYVTINNNGDIITCDNVTNSMFIQDKQGNVISEKRKFRILNSPTYICTQKDNSIILSDKGNHSIKIFNSAGEYMSQIGSSGKKEGQMCRPWGVATDGEYILAAEGGNNRIQVFKNDGSFVSMIESHADPIWGPRALAVTKDGHVYVVDRLHHCIKKYKYRDMPL